jgi:hypothetical protein
LRSSTIRPGRAGGIGEAAPGRELHGLLAIAHYVQADGRARLLERLCDHDDIPLVVFD